MTQPPSTKLAYDTIVHLIPVTELEPYHFQKEGRKSSSYPDTSEAWDRYWKDSLADSGITGLEPVRTGSWHVPIAQLTDPDILETIIREHCTPSYIDEDEEETGEWQIDPENLLAFSGGYALCLDEDVVFIPQCCGRMSDLESWESAAAYREDYATQVWIGHPELLVRFDGTLLIFSQTGPITESPEHCAVAPDKLGAAVRQADQERREFAAHLVPILKDRIGTEQAEEIAGTLVGC